MEPNYLGQFENPSSVFRGKPFWAWNCKLEKEELLRQLEYFKEMGMGGATIHCRTGLDTEYLGPEYMDIVKACVKRAKELGLQVCLYDEDRWPSGFGGGKVTKDERFRSRYLVFTPFPNESRSIRRTIDSVGSTASEKVKGNGKLLARYDVRLEKGRLAGYRRLAEGENGENVWYAYLEVSEGTPWFNNQTYVNTLDPRAIERFVQVTHETYRKAVGAEFGEEIPSIFTDEPQFVHKTTLGKAEDKKDAILPYTDDFEDTYRARYGESFLDRLPEVFWELEGGGVSLTRYHYHDHIAERFASAFSDTLGAWCGKNGIALTGHMMEEPTLQSQTAALGEAMRQYRGFAVPGIDMLCDRREYTTAKQAQSAAHQLGSRRVTSELYGVTNWDFDFRGHKLQGDWQAALGVTERVHHLAWASMAGEAKRDYPASIFHQSTWYRKYNAMETYFGRVNTALESGSPDVKVGVIHPIESYWLYYGPEEQTRDIREKLDENFSSLTEWLLLGLQDFDFISESLMEDLADRETKDAKGFPVGKMEYDVVLVPGCVTLRGSTVERLERFARRGGRVVFLGGAAPYVDARPSGRVRELADRCERIPFSRTDVLAALREERRVDLRDANGVRASHYVCQLRSLGPDRILFVANAKRPENIDLPHPERYTVGVKGAYEVTLLDALDGTRKKLPCTFADGYTRVEHEFYEEDSLLLYLKAADAARLPSAPAAPSAAGVPCCGEGKGLHAVSGYRMSEPNVLLLDQAEYSLDGEPLHGREEILRMDNLFREKLGYPRKMDAIAQPWTDRTPEQARHEAELRFRFDSSVELPEARFAMEGVSGARVWVNGAAADTEPEGFFVDKAIPTIRVRGIRKGANEIRVLFPYSRRANLEWCYLLGDFGVEVFGDRARIVEKPERIGFSDLTAQKFPFYAGNMTYCTEFDAEDGEYAVQVSKFRAPLLSVSLDGKEIGDIMFAPYAVSLGHLSGRHSLEITAYGSRINAFGAVHYTDEAATWYGPNAWRSEGCAYSYEYQLRKFGILAAPRLLRKK